MDHITSRFRRNKKEAPATPQDQSPASTPTSTTADGNVLSPENRNALPSLTITTSPVVTTPPGSSHGSHGLLPKSPLRGFSHFRTAHKRARSPAPVQTKASNSSDNAQADSPTDQLLTWPRKVSRKPQLPFFLNLSDSDIDYKFQELTWLERLRSQQGIQNPSPNNQFARVVSPEVKVLDRYNNIQPWANNRVHLEVPEGKLDYINASPIVSPSPLRPDKRPCFRYIAMQGPKANTVEHTWRMIAQNVKSPAVIVMLTDTHEGHIEKCYPYFPRTPNIDAIEVGEMDEFEDGFRARIECLGLEERQDGAIQMRKLNLHVDGHGDIIVWHLLYRKWPDFGVPNARDYESFLDLMKLSRELNSNIDNPRIIHCSAGVGRTGTFIALETLMREIDEGAMDCLDPDPDMHDNNDDLIFRTVNNLREQRRTMVQADSQYFFIHKVLRQQWLERHGLEGTSNGPAAQRNMTTRTPLGAPTAGRPRRSYRRQPPPPQIDNDSSDDSAPGGASLRNTED